MDKLLLIPIFLLDSIKYIKGNRLVYGKERHSNNAWVIGFFLTLFYSLATLFLPAGDIFHMLVVYTFAVFVGFASVREQNLFSRLTQLICLMVILLSIDQCVFIYLDLFERFFGNIIQSLYINALIKSVWGYIVILILERTFGRKRKPGKNFLSPQRINTILILISITLLTAIAVLNFIYRHLENGALPVILGFFISLSYVAVCFLLWIVLYFQSKKKQAEIYASAQEEIRQKQIEHYEKLLARENDTKAFRHDIKKQIDLMSALAKEDRLEDLKEHVLGLTDDYYALTQKPFYTGNDLFDILLTDKLYSLRKGVKVDIFGCFKKDFQMNSVDFCIIFSNLLENAIEALNDYDQPDAFLSVSVEKNETQHLITIKNSFDGYLSHSLNGTLLSTKEDDILHGFGLKNVEKAIEKYGGHFYLEEGDHVFITYVFL